MTTTPLDPSIPLYWHRLLLPFHPLGVELIRLTRIGCLRFVPAFVRIGFSRFIPTLVRVGSAQLVFCFRPFTTSDHVRVLAFFFRSALSFLTLLSSPLVLTCSDVPSASLDSASFFLVSLCYDRFFLSDYVLCQYLFRFSQLV